MENRSYTGFWDQKFQFISFHYCRGAQSACKREEKRKAEVISLEGTSRSEWRITLFSGKVAELSVASGEGSGQGWRAMGEAAVQSPFTLATRGL